MSYCPKLVPIFITIILHIKILIYIHLILPTAPSGPLQTYIRKQVRIETKPVTQEPTNNVIIFVGSFMY